jgi:uncharacterized Tic20 family protein
MWETRSVLSWTGAVLMESVHTRFYQRYVAVNICKYPSRSSPLIQTRTATFAKTSSSSSSSWCSWRVRHVSLFLDPQDEVDPSISSSVVLCFFVCLVYIVVLVLVVCLCPSSVHVVSLFLVLFYFLYCVLCSSFFLLNTLILFFLCKDINPLYYYQQRRTPTPLTAVLLQPT